MNTQPPQPCEITQIRDLMVRLTAANERFMRAALRLLAVPGPDDLLTMISNFRPDRPPPVDVPIPPLDGLAIHDFLGTARVKTASGQSNLFLLLLKGGQHGDEAAQHFCDLAAESGRVYQTLPCSLAPIDLTTSPRNLWASVLHGWLHGTTWVQQAEGYAFIPLPFAASVELWRRLLYGTTPDGRVNSESNTDRPQPFAENVQGPMPSSQTQSTKVESQGPSRQTAEAQTLAHPLAPAPEIELESMAIALLLQHTDWSVAQIADSLKVDRKTPYKWKKFRKAAELDGRLKPRGPKERTPRRGHKTPDGQVEAYAEEDAEE